MPDIEVLLNDVRNYASQKALEDLLEEGMDDNFIRPLVEKFRNGVLTKASISDLTDELKLYTIGSDTKAGVLERYVKQVHSDSITQYIANYTEILTEDAGLQFYVYLGNIQKDTRCFCNERAGQYFHRLEIEAWGRGENAGCGFPWAGMIAGTNSSNIFTYRGGWNCEHQLIPTLTTLAPKDVVLRAYGKGFFIPTKKEKDFFGIE